MKTVILQVLAVSVIMRALTCFGASQERVVVMVVDSEVGRPIAMATVARIQSDQSLPVAEGQTDGEGRTTLNCEPGVLTSFLVTAPGRRPQTFSFWGCIPPSHRIALLPSGGTMGGRLEDATGKPIAGAPGRRKLSPDSSRGLPAMPCMGTMDRPLAPWELAKER
jgi:hypothetical protein